MEALKRESLLMEYVVHFGCNHHSISIRLAREYRKSFIGGYNKRRSLAMKDILQETKIIGKEVYQT